MHSALLAEGLVFALRAQTFFDLSRYCCRRKLSPELKGGIAPYLTVGPASRAGGLEERFAIGTLADAMVVGACALR